MINIFNTCFLSTLWRKITRKKDTQEAPHTFYVIDKSYIIHEYELTTPGDITTAIKQE